MKQLLKKLLRRKIRVSAHGRTDPGMIRKQNEDAFSILADGRLLLVADGMGGHRAGERASRLAVDFLVAYFSPDLITRSAGNPQEARYLLTTGFRRANEVVIQQAETDESLHGMGCTLLAGLIDQGVLHTCHVGDSRCYRAGSEGLQLLTSDHATSVPGRGSAVEGSQPAERRVLTRSIGFPFHEDPEYNLTDLQEGDRLLFCTDGLWSMLPENKLRSILDTAPSPEAACDSLVEAANKAGGRDNITAVVVFV